MAQIPSSLPPAAGSSPNGGTSTSQMQQINQFYQSQAGVAVLQSLATDIEELEQAGQGATPGANANEQAAIQLATQEIQALSALVSLLQNTPTSPPPSASTQASLNQMATTLQSMAQGLQGNPPQIPSGEELNSLSGMLTQLNGLIPNYPAQTQLTYWTSQVQLFSQLTQTVSNLSQYTSQAQTLNQFLQAEESFNQLAQSPPPIDTTELTQSMESLVNLITEIPNLPQSVQSQVLGQLSAIQNQVGFASSTNGSPVVTADNMESLGLIYEWTQQYITQTPAADQSEGGWQQFLTAQSQNLFQSGTGVDSALSAVHNDLSNFLDSSQLATTWTSLSSSAPPSFSAFLQLSSINSIVSPNSSSAIALLQQFASLYQQLNSEPNPSDMNPINIHDFTGLPTFLNVVEQLTNPTTWNQLTPQEQSYLSSSLNVLANGDKLFQLTPVTSSSPSFSLPQLLAMDQLSTWANQAPAGTNLPLYLATQLQGFSFSTTPIGQAEQQAMSQMLSPSGQISTPLPIVESYQSPTQWSPFSDQTAGGTMWDNVLIAIQKGSLPPLASFPDAYQPLNPQSLASAVALFSAQANLLTPYEAQLSASAQALTQAWKGAAVQAAQASAAGGTSLQQAFANIILNHYMPGQENYLQNQAIQLNFSNWLGQEYNQLMNDTTGFSSASTLIAFSKLLSSPESGTTGVFQGSYAMAAATLNNEKNAVAQNLQGAQQAQTLIQQLLQQLTPPGTPGPEGTAQYLNPNPPNPALADSINQTRATLQNELQSINQAISNLTILQQQLVSITISPPTNSTSYPASNYFQVNVTQGGVTAQIQNNQITQLSQMENSVVQGGSSTGIGDVGQILDNPEPYPKFDNTFPPQLSPTTPSLVQNSVENTQQALTNEESAVAQRLANTSPSAQPLYSELQQLQTLLQGIQVVNPPTQMQYLIAAGLFTEPTNLSPSTSAGLLYQGKSVSTQTIQEIQNLEATINSQIPPGPVSGGLTTIAQDYSTQSQNASNQSQTQQMQLQLVMTEIQQEWTVVSTALQILNQTYMSIAQAISSP